MNINEIESYYSNIITKYQGESDQLKKVIFWVGTIRLIIAIAAVVCAYILWGDTSIVIASIIIFFVAFLALMKYHNRLFIKKSYCEQQITNAQNELKGINYDFSAFDGAPEKTDAEHSFSLDLDLFGKRSFFQSINRTVTSFGKDTLANIFIHPFENKKDILDQQQAVKELKQKGKLLSHFRAIGQMSEADSLNSKDFSASFKRAPILKNSILWKSMVYIMPLIHILFGLLVYFDMMAGGYYSIVYILTLGISFVPGKKVMQIMETFNEKSKVLDTYSKLFKIIEDENVQSDKLKNIQSQLKGVANASYAINQLKSYHNNLTVSYTFPVLMLFNPYLLWNVKYAIKVEQWTEKYKSEIAQWFEAIAQFDMLVSMGIFAFNHPDYTYPQVADKFIFEGKALGHPMLHRDTCVRNDVNISKTPFFLVITGANMAGKSTYLRTIGINHTMACAGVPVCAESLTFYPCRLVTNLRTADSLADNESYFFAELKRLKMIIDRLQAGEELFIILDEILKGTNSEDKQKGSMALMKQLISLNGNGIIATHDLLLGNLEQEYPDNVKDYRFEADITNDQLTFSYKIREGVAQNMNACFLMKKMGITGL
ncbi:hypothetical protein G7050_13450 [Dysgonomonas sp. HDW5A]|uniref:MutS-related protein n=1 Tax=Dysgonomonas sp. HDW5A TaxID=2714926 RepID=UPI00140AFCFD|nr:hypothetical protein [Dysgonomonas sp. HDW5A]QIK60788.1 hypothetical protein G7050_13450 [Dysgonomonas sp. HDW5A]